MNAELLGYLFVHHPAIIVHNSYVPVSPARQAAYSILIRVQSGRCFAVDLLQSDEVSQLKDADKRLTTEIVMGVLRWQGALDAKIASLSGKPIEYFDAEVVTILRISVYQVLFLRRIPAHAVVNEGVELTKAARKRSATGLVNAILRKCKPVAGLLDPHGAVSSGPEALEAVKAATPAWMLERWEKHFGSNAASSLARASLQIPPTTLRARAGDRQTVAARLREQGIETEPCRFVPHALSIRGGEFYASELFRSGEVAVQDEASQLVAALVNPNRGDRLLDLCAAPGIKTAQMAEALGEGTMVSCDSSANRLATMKRLLDGRLPGGVRAEVLHLDATFKLPFQDAFERILVDAPCSGTGTLARNPEIKWRLKPDELSRLSGMQSAILANALEVLAPGGRLVYVTCSLESEENENVVAAALVNRPGFRLLGKEELAREFPAWAELFDASGYFSTRPDLHGMDGFFAAVITK
jgi:16S rRNA (cytosine967-C5)-methyltransferase